MKPVSDEESRELGLVGESDRRVDGSAVDLGSEKDGTVQVQWHAAMTRLAA